MRMDPFLRTLRTAWVNEERERILTGLDETEWHHHNDEQWVPLERTKDIVKDEQ